MNDRRLPDDVRRLYHLLLRTVADSGSDATSGSFPYVSDMRVGGDPASFGVLVDAGLIVHDVDSGLVETVMPLVAHPLSVRVLLDGDEWSQCDAAGVLDGVALASLLERRTRLVDACCSCGGSVTVTIDPSGIQRREPRSAVVARVFADDSRQGRYDTARLACSPEHARAAIEAMGNKDAVIQSLETLYIESLERYLMVGEQ